MNTNNITVDDIIELEKSIINLMNDYLIEWSNISTDTATVWGGKIEAMNIAKQIVDRKFDELLDNKFN